MGQALSRSGINSDQAPVRTRKQPGSGTHPDQETTPPAGTFSPCEEFLCGGLFSFAQDRASERWGIDFSSLEYSLGSLHLANFFEKNKKNFEFGPDQNHPPNNTVKTPHSVPEPLKSLPPTFFIHEPLKMQQKPSVCRRNSLQHRLLRDQLI